MGSIVNRILIWAVFICALAVPRLAPVAAFPMQEETVTESGTDIDDESAPTESKVKTAKSESKSAKAKSDGVTAKEKDSSIDMGMWSLYFGYNDWNFVGLMTLRFVINMIFAYILICWIYAKEHRIREISFSFFVSNILIFMVTSLMASVKMKTGFAFGLFAILSILRYRTEQIQIREMTFLFTSIILGVINSLATSELTIFAILWANIVLLLCVSICDKIFMGHTDQIILLYDNTRLLGKGMQQELYEDIKKRFGYDVIKVIIVKMNYLTDSAEVKLVFKR